MNVKKVVKICSYSGTIVVIMLVFFFNVGNYLDTTVPPTKSDIIVCLGGGTQERVQKSISLYNQGYSKHNKLLLIGENDTNIVYIRNNEPKLNFVHNANPKNTDEEVGFIKYYMQQNNYKSALIVTDPHHSRRVSQLTSLIIISGDENMTFSIIDSGVVWWDKQNYYRNKQAIAFARHEIIGILYNYMTYGILSKMGLWTNVEDPTDS